MTAPDASGDDISRTGFDNPAVVFAAIALLLGGAVLVVLYSRKRKA